MKYALSCSDEEVGNVTFLYPLAEGHTKQLDFEVTTKDLILTLIVPQISGEF